MLKSVCLKKHAVPEDTFVKCKNGEFANDETLKCYFACTLKTMQLVSPKGILEKKPFADKMRMLSPPSIMEVILPAIEQCTDKDVGNVCENAFNFMKCSYEVNSKTMNYFPI
ncbi:general odorant-binding protein 72-like isoform X2 [Adelges cooleyi]|nr:general odorant-binding protein 72-like isoform X2 [Adelges cooleyi]